MASEDPLSPYLGQQNRTLLLYFQYGLLWLAWLFYLGGLAAVQNTCKSIERPVVGQNGRVFNSVECNSEFSYQWWIMVLQLLWLILVGVLLYKGWLLWLRHPVMLLTLLLVIKAMDNANYFLQIMWNYPLPELETTRFGVAVAGSILLCVFGLVFILFCYLWDGRALINPLAGLAQGPPGPTTGSLVARPSGALPPGSRVATPIANGKNPTIKIRPGEFQIPMADV